MERGPKKRASIRIGRGPEGLRGLAPGGLEVPGSTPETFAARLADSTRTLKRALTAPARFAGSGTPVRTRSLISGASFAAAKGGASPQGKGLPLAPPRAARSHSAPVGSRPPRSTQNARASFQLTWTAGWSGSAGAWSGPRGCRQSAPSTATHQGSEGTTLASGGAAPGGWKTSDQPKRSASVSWPVRATKSAKSAVFVSRRSRWNPRTPPPAGIQAVPGGGAVSGGGAVPGDGAQEPSRGASSEPTRRSRAAAMDFAGWDRDARSASFRVEPWRSVAAMDFAEWDLDARSASFRVEPWRSAAAIDFAGWDRDGCRRVSPCCCSGRRAGRAASSETRAGTPFGSPGR